MPSCFQLTRRGDREPSSLAHIDNCICQYLGVNANPKQYHDYWYDTIGLMLAMGHSFDYIIDKLWEYEDYPRLVIAAYLADNYVSDSWHER